MILLHQLIKKSWVCKRKTYFFELFFSSRFCSHNFTICFLIFFSLFFSSFLRMGCACRGLVRKGAEGGFTPLPPLIIWWFKNRTEIDNKLLPAPPPPRFENPSRALARRSVANNSSVNLFAFLAFFALYCPSFTVFRAQWD